MDKLWRAWVVWMAERSDRLVLWTWRRMMLKTTLEVLAAREIARQEQDG